MFAAVAVVLPACTRSGSTSEKAAPSTPPQVAVNPVPPAATIAPPAGANATATSPAPLSASRAQSSVTPPSAPVSLRAAIPPPSSPGGAIPAESPAVGTPASAPVGATPASPSGAATVAPSALPTGPRIVSVSATPSVVHNGDTVHWDVRTSPDVVGVSAKVATYGFDLQRSGPGHFTLGFAIPKSVPFFFHRTYTLDVVARDGAGATANTTIALSFQ